MTPLQMAIALHYINETTDYNNGDFSDPLVADTIKLYQTQGLLAQQVAGQTPTLIATSGLKTYVDELAKIPMPKQIWAFWP